MKAEDAKRLTQDCEESYHEETRKILSDFLENTYSEIREAARKRCTEITKRDHPSLNQHRFIELMRRDGYKVVRDTEGLQNTRILRISWDQA